MYLDDLATAIRRCVPEDRVPDGDDAHELFRIYAVLLLAKGVRTTERDVHNAWSAWMARSDEHHAALKPYEELEEEVAREDRVFAEAIWQAARETGNAVFEDTLFPSGAPAAEVSRAEVLDLYKVMVTSSEALVGRRQAVNTFFLTMNGALLTAVGLIVQSNEPRLGSMGVVVLAAAGLLLCLAWRSLITSFGQLNTGKFKVINSIERHLSAAIYAAEWEALERGENPEVYRSFTSREIWVPNTLGWIYGITVWYAGLVALGVVSAG